jgi:hypothetical protein
MQSGWIPVGAAAAASALLLFAAQPDSPGGMLLAVLATLPLFLVGLSWGVFHGAATGAAAAIAILFAVGLPAGLYYAVVNALPAALLIWQAERAPNQPTRLVLTLTACAALPIVAAVLFFAPQEGGLEGIIRERLEPMLASIATGPEGSPPPELAVFIDAFAGLFPALAATFWALLIAINATLAQGVLKRFDKSRVRTPDIAAIRIPRWMLAAFAATLVFSAFGGGIGYLANNLVPVATLPFLFAGLAVMHWALRRSSASALWLGLLYGLLVLFGWPALVLLLIGMLDTIFDFRGRAGPPAAPPVV